MNPEPRQRDDYTPRQIEAAHRVLVDLGQVLAGFTDCLVVVGGWVPDLLLEQADEPHKAVWEGRGPVRSKAASHRVRSPTSSSSGASSELRMTSRA